MEFDDEHGARRRQGRNGAAVQAAGAQVQYVYVIDDQYTARMVLTAIASTIRGPVKVRSFESATEALANVERFPPALSLCDIQMDDMNGIQYAHAIRSLPDVANTPIFLVTADESPRLQEQIAEAAVTDCFYKPVDFVECRMRCEALLDIARRDAQLAAEGRPGSAQIAAISDAIATAAPSGARLRQLAATAGQLAGVLGVSDDIRIRIEHAAPYHDVGMSLLGPQRGHYTTADRMRMETHTVLGEQVLLDPESPSEDLNVAAQVAKHHHERFDGAGYPNGLAGRDIPFEAAVVGLAVRVQAMRTGRRNRTPLTDDAVRFELQKERGRAFAPELVDAYNDALAAG